MQLKTRTILVFAGLAIGIASIIGARELTNASSPAAPPNTNSAPRAQGGPVVMGTVDTDPPPVAYGLPPVLQSGTIAIVHVKDGDEVKASQPLYEFDSTIQKADVEQAKSAVAYAQTKVREAEELAKQHKRLVEVAEAGVDIAKIKEEETAQYYHLVEKNIEALYAAEKHDPATWPERKKREGTLFKANVDYRSTVSERKLKEADLARLKAVDPQVKVLEAEAAVKQAEAVLAKAQVAVDLCIVKAKGAGTIEQVTIGPGTTLGVGTRTPALWLIPDGPRVVRGEVEADFAHRVGPDIQGKTVTIHDHSDPKLTYSGIVKRVGTTFLLKRGSTENFLASDTRVLEVVIEVADPAPQGKPPLYVGKRVRVNLGQ